MRCQKDREERSPVYAGDLIVYLNPMELWRPYVISGLIGLLVGIEREKAHPHRKAMGIRSFLLLALLGSIAGGVDETWLGATIAAFAMASIVASYLLLSRAGLDDHGLTPEFSSRPERWRA